MAPPPTPTVVPVGHNDTQIWGMSSQERIRRIAAKLGLAFDPAVTTGQTRILTNVQYAFDPELLRHMADQPGSILLDTNGIAIIAHSTAEDESTSSLVEQRMSEGSALPPSIAARTIVADQNLSLYNHQLRKRESPFVLPLTPATRAAIERASYYAAYKGVTDLLTKYLWPELALLLTKAAARLGFSPNAVTAVGAILCILTAILFWHGEYWWGMGTAFGFMVLDTVDGKLARCTLTSSKLGNILDHGIDQVHPPFWWWAWAAGLSAWSLAITRAEFALVMAVVIGGYLVQRLIEGIFMRRFHMHIHVWEEIDSRFRLITARRNPNMVLLLGSLLFGRPDVGLELVAAWTILSCLFHGLRLGQALLRRRHGLEITSWLH